MYSEIKEAVKQIAPGVAKAVDQTTGQQVQLDRMSQQIDNMHNLMRSNTSKETEVLGIVSETSLTVGALIREYQKVSLTVSLARSWGLCEQRLTYPGMP